MFDRIKSVLQFLFVYQPSKIEEEFIKLNSKLWKSNSSSKITNDVCLVEGQIECPASIIDKARMAKAVEEASGARPLVFIRGFYIRGNNVAHIYKSFNIEEFYLWWRPFFNPCIILPSIFETIKVYFFYRSGDEILKLNYKGVHIGDLIYDTLIRFKPNSYTIDKIRLIHFRLLLRSFITFNINQNLIKKINPKYLITSHNVYAEFGMLPRQIRHTNNGVVLLKDIYAYKFYDTKTNINEHFLKVSTSDFYRKLGDDDCYAKAQEYFKKRLTGHIDQIDVKNAYKNKKNYNIYELKCLYPKIDINKKNVIVMSHAFSDAPHVGEGLLFKDYYDFLECTLIKLNENTSINAFVKAHPSSYMWNEEGGVEKIIKRNKLDNIYIMPTDLNTNSICDLADLIITAKGTAGLEFSCLGIPALTAGKGFYYNFGVSIEPSSVNEFYLILDSLPSNIEPLPESIKRRALILLYMVSLNRHHSRVLPRKHIMPDENYHDVFQDKYHEVVNNIKNGEHMKDYFYDMVKEDVVNCKW